MARIATDEHAVPICCESGRPVKKRLIDSIRTVEDNQDGKRTGARWTEYRSSHGAVRTRHFTPFRYERCRSNLVEDREKPKERQTEERQNEP
jgi:hypothetical protein